jgi:hypothetical protein
VSSDCRRVLLDLALSPGMVSLVTSLFAFSPIIGLKDGKLMDGTLGILSRESCQVSEIALNLELTCSETCSHFVVSSNVVV